MVVSFFPFSSGASCIGSLASKEGRPKIFFAYGQLLDAERPCFLADFRKVLRWLDLLLFISLPFFFFVLSFHSSFLLFPFKMYFRMLYPKTHVACTAAKQRRFGNLDGLQYILSSTISVVSFKRGPC